MFLDIEFGDEMWDGCGIDLGFHISASIDAGIDEMCDAGLDGGVDEIVALLFFVGIAFGYLDGEDAVEGGVGELGEDGGDIIQVALEGGGVGEGRELLCFGGGEVAG